MKCTTLQSSGGWHSAYQNQLQLISNPSFLNVLWTISNSDLNKSFIVTSHIKCATFAARLVAPRRYRLISNSTRFNYFCWGFVSFSDELAE